MNKTSNYFKIIFFSTTLIISAVAFIILKLSDAPSVVIPIMIGFASGGALLVYGTEYDLIIKDNILITIALLTKKRYVLTEIEKIDLWVTSHGVFSVTIHGDNFSTFSVCYTQKNFEVLQELTRLCQNPASLTTEELEAKVERSNYIWTLK